MRWRRIVQQMVIAAAILSGLPACAQGPWKAQIVDAETGQPLQGVVVLAYWIKTKASPGGWAGGEFYDSEEVVTGPDGVFAVHSRRSYSIPGVTKVSGPEWVIFKPGYGQWRFRGSGKNFYRGQEVVIELPRLETREERLKFLRSVTWSGLVPSDRTQGLLRAKDTERAYLGLGR